MTDGSKPKEHIIRFSVNNGDFIYDEKEDVSSYIKTKHKDIIKWINDEQCAFSISFGWDSPFGECYLQAREGETIKTEVPAEAQNGDFKYTIAVYDDGKVWIDDPRIIIKPPTG